MGNKLYTLIRMGSKSLGPREKGKASKTSTGSGKNVEISSGGGAVERKESEVSSSSHIREDTSNPSRLEVNAHPKKDGKGGKPSSKVVLENRTDKLLVLRVKLRAANGPVRYQIEANKSIEIEKQRHLSFYRFLVYAVEVQDDNTPTTEDTGLSFSSDDLFDAAHTVFVKDEAGKYSFLQES